MDKEQLRDALERYEGRGSIKSIPKEEWFATVDGYQLNFAQMIVRCRDCKHFHLNVFGDEIGIGKPYCDIIVAHEMCDAWGDGCKTSQDGWCFMGERKNDKS